MFRQAGLPVWDADETVHKLYAKGGQAVAPIATLCPQAKVDGAIDRTRLKACIARDPTMLSWVEHIVHPLTFADRKAFLAGTETDIALFDIPLLFETGADKEADAIVVVSTDEATQRERVLSRPGMDEKTFQTILARQIPDSEKRARADFVIITDTLEHAREQVQSVLTEIRNRLTHA